MAVIFHISVFVLSAFVIWFFAGLLVDTVTRVAHRVHRSNFGVAFFVLGILTSLSELSVAVNATIDRVPDVSAGNLMGASLVIALLIVPVLAIAGGGIEIRHTLSLRRLALVFGVILAPGAFLLDGGASRGEGAAMVLLYGLLVWFIRSASFDGTFQAIKSGLAEERGRLAADVGKLLIGALAIFFAGHWLVKEAVYFADALRVPGSLIGLLVLSIGTNVPEIVVAARAVMKRHKEIAFGDYIGSAAANTLIFGGLAIANGPFTLGAREFLPTFALLAVGLALLYGFSRSNRFISRREGYVLLVLYAAFFALQAGNILGRGAPGM